VAILQLAVVIICPKSKNAGAIFFISGVPKQGSAFESVIIIQLIRAVLKALTPQTDRYSKKFWGKGASIYGPGY